MAKTISDEWLASMPSQFHPERIVQEDLAFYEVDSTDELREIPACSMGSVAILRGENPVMYMKSTTGWVAQTTTTNGKEAKISVD